MFSAITTGTCRRPSWTAIVSPSMSGMIIEARDQVLMTTLPVLRRAASTFLASLASTNAPFFILLDVFAPYPLSL